MPIPFEQIASSDFILNEVKERILQASRSPTAEQRALFNCIDSDALDTDAQITILTAYFEAEETALEVIAPDAHDLGIPLNEMPLLMHMIINHDKIPPHVKAPLCLSIVKQNRTTRALLFEEEDTPHFDHYMSALEEQYETAKPVGSFLYHRHVSALAHNLLETSTQAPPGSSTQSATLTDGSPIVRLNTTQGPTYAVYGKEVPMLSTKSIAKTLSLQYKRILGALIASTAPIPQELRIFFALNHNGDVAATSREGPEHWTALVLTISINERHRKDLEALQRHIHQTSSPQEPQQRAETIMKARLGQPGAYKELLYVDRSMVPQATPDEDSDLRLIYASTLEASHIDSFQANGRKGSYEDKIREAIQCYLSPKNPHIRNMIFKTLPCMQQGSNTCGDHTVWNGFCYSVYGETKRIHNADQVLRDISQTPAGNATKRQEKVVALLNSDLRAVTETAAAAPAPAPPSSAMRSRTNAALSPPPSRTERLKPPPRPETPPTTRTEPPSRPPEAKAPPSRVQQKRRSPKAASATSEPIRQLERLRALKTYTKYTGDHPKLKSFGWGALLFLKAFLTVNILGLGFKKYLVARRLRNEIMSAENFSVAPTVISGYRRYNDHLEWLEHNKACLSYRENFLPLNKSKLKNYPKERLRNNDSELGKILKPKAP